LEGRGGRGGGGDDLDRWLAQLTSGGAVDSELEKMKAELAAGAAPQQLPSGGEKEAGS
jgi:phage shock protein A